VRYPIVEAFTGALFILYYLTYFVAQSGFCLEEGTRASIEQDWPIYSLYMLLIAGLLGASLIDAELFIIPLEIPWLLAGIGFVVHAIVDRPGMPGALNVAPGAAALAFGATLGLVVSLVLNRAGIIPSSFRQGEPLLEIDREQLAVEIENAKREGRDPADLGPLPPPYTSMQIRAEMLWEVLFLLPPLLLGAACCAMVLRFPSVGEWWAGVAGAHWISGLAGSLLGALVGAVVVWAVRILGTFGFGRVAMGLGDVHLMFGVGAILGAGPTTVAFFIAPFFGILIAIYMLLTGKKRELPYGPYLSLGTAATMIFYCAVSAHLAPGLRALVWMVTGTDLQT